MDYIHYVIELIMAAFIYLARQNQRQRERRTDRIEKRLEELEKSNMTIQLEYLPKQDFSDFRKELWQRLDKLDDKIDELKK